MRRKPAGLEPSYAAQFNDAWVVAAHATRPPYADQSVPFLVDLAGRADARILDLGCGSGELARRIAPSVHAITAIDCSDRMIALARALPGGDAPNVEWIVREVASPWVDRLQPLIAAFSTNRIMSLTIWSTN